MRDGLEVLEERGFVKQCTDLEALRNRLHTEEVTFYCGFDPTHSSLHAGHLIPLFAMAHLARAGHRAIALVGGGTARIGDPSGKTEMRQMLSVEEIKSNAQSIREQISRFIDFKKGKAVLEDNAKWLANLNYIDFLRDIGRHFSVNRMLSYETYKARLETGLTFIEFNYQLLQAYDFLVLFKKYGCRLQIGGDDQWGNIVAGMDLIRRVEGEEAYGLTFPLVTRADGKKMGKTEEGALFLNSNFTTAYEFYQYWRNVPDQDVERFLLLYTFLPVEEIGKLGKLKDKEINFAKEKLAFEITKIVHGEEKANNAREAAKAAFDRSQAEGNRSAIPYVTVSGTALSEGISAIELFTKTPLCSSNSEARRLINQGGAYINEKKITDINERIDSSWLEDDELLLRAGKKRYFRVIVEV